MQGFVKIIEKCYLFFKKKKKYQCQSVIGNSALFLQSTHSLFTPKMAICASYFAEMELFSTNFWKEISTLQQHINPVSILKCQKLLKKPNGMKDIYL